MISYVAQHQKNTSIHICCLTLIYICRLIFIHQIHSLILLINFMDFFHWFNEWDSTCDLWILMYILHQLDRLLIRIQSKKITCVELCLISFASGAFFYEKSCLRCILFHKKSGVWASVLISVSCLVYRFIGIENDSNSNIQSSQRQNL